MSDERNTRKSDPDLQFDFGGLLGGLGDVLARLNEVLQESGTAQQGGEQELRDAQGNVRGRVGWSVRPLSSMPPRSPSASSGGSVPGRVVKKPARPPQPMAREPLVEVFDEGHQLMVIAELPGVQEGDIDLRLEEAVLHLAATGARPYAVQVNLPRPARTVLSTQLNNGILEVRLQ